MPPTYHLCSKSLPTCLRTNGTEKIEHTEYKNHHFVSLRRKFWKFIQARTFPSVFKNKEVAACSSNWAEGQAKTPKRLNKLEQVWAWSGYYPTATLLMSPITLRSNNQKEGAEFPFWEAERMADLPPVLSPEGTVMPGTNKMSVGPNRPQPRGHCGSEIMVRKLSQTYRSPRSMLLNNIDCK